MWKQINELNISDENKIKFILLTGKKELANVPYSHDPFFRNILEILLSGEACPPAHYLDKARVLLALKVLIIEAGLEIEESNGWIKIKNW